MVDPLKAKSWLLYPDRKSVLPDSARLLLEEIQENLENGGFIEMEEGLQLLIFNRDRFPNHQVRAEMTLEAALGWFMLNNLDMAIRLLTEAQRLFRPQDHFVAVVLWMKGCIHARLESPEEIEAAYLAWSEALDIFEARRKIAISEEHSQWYQARVDEVREAILSLDHTRPQPEPASVGNGWVPEFSQAETEDAPAPDSLLDGLALQLFRVVEEIPAGGFGPVSPDQFTIGEVDVKEVWIDGVRHRMVNLADSSQLFKLRQNKYIVARVNGDSMNRPNPKFNREGIDDGDYVLIRIQTTADNGDIVAAEIDGVDESATLKQFRVEKNGEKFLLMPNSTNPQHQPFEFDRLNEGFTIRGVALVLFKPAA